MPLNSSGPISIGGSTSGQSINLELGRSATATSNLNETALRTLAGVASGAISLSNFYGKSNASFSPTGGDSGSPEPLYGFNMWPDSAYIEITCTQSATWTWSKSGAAEAYASVASGGSATAIGFTLPADQFTPRTATFEVSATVGGLTRYWTVNLDTDSLA